MGDNTNSSICQASQTSVLCMPVHVYTCWPFSRLGTGAQLPATSRFAGAPTSFLLTHHVGDADRHVALGLEPGREAGRVDSVLYIPLHHL